jgi:hypothetical protein
MRNQIGLLAIVGVFGLLAAAKAETASTTGGPFDGTYQFVSGATLTKTFIIKGGGMGHCPEHTQPGPLTIINGHAQYTSGSGRQLAGSVNSQGHLDLRLISSQPGLNMHVDGMVDGAGTVRVRQKGNSCSYNFVWQKQ